MLLRSVTICVCFVSMRVAPPVYAEFLDTEWSTSIGTVAVTPAISEDGQSLFVATADGLLLAFDPKNGNRRWKKQLSDGVDFATADLLVANDGQLFVGCKSGLLRSIDAKDGTERWAYRTNGSIRSAPALGLSGNVYFGCDDNFFYSLDQKTGELLWDKPFQTNSAIIGHPTILGDGYVVFGSGSKWYAVDPLTGEAKKGWSVNQNNCLIESGASVALDGTLISAAGNAIATITSSGQLKTVYRHNGYGFETPIPTPDGGIICVIRYELGKGMIFRLSLRSGEWIKEWGYSVTSKFIGSPVIDDKGNIVVVSENGDTHLFSKDGDLLKKTNLGTSILAAPVLYDKKLFVPTEDGIQAVKANAGTWRFAGKNAQRTALERRGYFLPGELIYNNVDRLAGDNWFKTPQNAQPKIYDLDDNEVSNFAHVESGPLGQGEATKVWAVNSGTFVIKWFRVEETERRTSRLGAELERERRKIIVAPVPIQRIELGEEVAMPLNAKVDDVKQYVGWTPVPPSHLRTIVQDDLPPPFANYDENPPTEAKNNKPISQKFNDRWTAVSPGKWTVAWTGKGEQLIPVRYHVVWPKKMQLHVARESEGNPIDYLNSIGLENIQTESDSERAHVELELLCSSVGKDTKLADSLSRDGKFNPARPGKYFISVTENNVTSFLAVDSRSWEELVARTVNHPIGKEIVPPDELHDPKSPGPWVVFKNARYCTEVNHKKRSYFKEFYSPTNRTGPIIPVNVESRDNVHNDKMVIAFFTKCDSLLSATVDSSIFYEWPDEQRFYGAAKRKVTQAVDHESYWPTSTVRYLCDWPNIEDNAMDPQAPSHIVIANEAGSGVQSEDVFHNKEIYWQDNPELPGFNPNDEHAHIDDGTVFAIRNDLATEDSSEPYVLMTYLNKENNGRASMKVFKVWAERGNYTFNSQAVEAGTPLRPPRPIRGSGNNLFAKLKCLTPDTGRVIEEENQKLWPYKAGDDGGTDTLTVRYWYQPKADGGAPFYFPVEHFGEGFEDYTNGFPKDHESTTSGSSKSEELAQSIPWLARYRWRESLPKSNGENVEWNKHAVTDQPVDVSYQVRWPEDPAILNVGETIVTQQSDRDLPRMTAYSSVEVLYQQSNANREGHSVDLIDWESERSVPLGKRLANVLDANFWEAAEPPKKAPHLNQTYLFPSLPPHLQFRLFYRETNRKPELVFRGLICDNIGRPASSGDLDSLVMLNVFTDDDKQAMLQLAEEAGISDDGENAFQSAVNKLFAEANSSKIIRAQLDPKGVGKLEAQNKAGLAVYAGGKGYVSLLFNTAEKSQPPNTSMKILKVDPDLAKGRVLVIESENPFSEQVTLRHSADFQGQPQQFEFQWRVMNQNDFDDLRKDQQDDPSAWPAVSETATGRGIDSYLLKGTQALGKLRVACGYRRAGTTEFSWTDPTLVNGWVDRIIAKVNLFDSRFPKFREQDAETIVDMLEIAGERYEGDIALVQRIKGQKANEYLRNFGLIAVYEAVLRKVKELSIEGNPRGIIKRNEQELEAAIAQAFESATDKSELERAKIEHDLRSTNKVIENVQPSVNEQLVTITSALTQLYTLLGNEAYADALDPTVTFAASDTQYVGQVYSDHVFKGVTASLLEEELALLRGVSPSGREYMGGPVYNRLKWNAKATDPNVRPLYNLNYLVTARNKSDDGKTPQQLAEQSFPQGHGDAWGHYLTATKYAYNLVRNPNFVWPKRTETPTDVEGKEYTITPFDEQKFLRAAVAKANVGADIVALTRRQHYESDQSSTLQLTSESKNAWGVTDWATRAGQGAYFDWILGNTMLAESNARGVKINRESQVELHQLPSLFDELQRSVDEVNAGLNPLGLPEDAIRLAVEKNNKNFPKAAERARSFVANAKKVLNAATSQKLLRHKNLRKAQEFARMVDQREDAYSDQLIQIFGYPYPEDIGGQNKYPDDYTGPDLFFSFKRDPRPADNFVDGASKVIDKSVVIDNTSGQFQFLVNEEGQVRKERITLNFSVGADPWDMSSIATETKTKGQRKAKGRIQLLRSDLYSAGLDFIDLHAQYRNHLGIIRDKFEILRLQKDWETTKIEYKTTNVNRYRSLNDKILSYQRTEGNLRALERQVIGIANGSAELLPTSLGFSNDATSGARGAIKLVAQAIAEGLRTGARNASLKQTALVQEKEKVGLGLELRYMEGDQNLLEETLHRELSQIIRDEIRYRIALYKQQERIKRLADQLDATIQEGLRIWDQRTRFRAAVAEETRERRYLDMAFRIFRTEATQSYRRQFDLAAQQVFLAAKAYDYDTNFEITDRSRPSKLVDAVVKARLVGQENGNSSLTNAGLSDILAILEQNYRQLEIPPTNDYVQLSLRQHLYRIPKRMQDSDAQNNADDSLWEQILESHYQPELLRNRLVREYCDTSELKGGGFVIPFSTPLDLTNTTNAFGRIYTSFDDGKTRLASKWYGTKILETAVLLQSSSPSTPDVFLALVGFDDFRSVADNSRAQTRRWKIRNYKLTRQALVLEDIYRESYDDELDTETGRLRATIQTSPEIARLLPFRAIRLADQSEFGALQYDRQLAGRSVFNTHWLLVIPEQYMAEEANKTKFQSFIEDVSDIRLHIKYTRHKEIN